MTLTKIKFYGVVICTGMLILLIAQGGVWPLKNRGRSEHETVTLIVSGSQTRIHPARVTQTISGTVDGPFDVVESKWTRRVEVERGQRVTLQAVLTYDGDITVTIKYKSHIQVAYAHKAKQLASVSVVVAY